MLISKVMIKKVNGGKACDVVGMLNIAKGTLGCVDFMRRFCGKAQRGIVVRRRLHMNRAVECHCVVNRSHCYA